MSEATKPLEKPTEPGFNPEAVGASAPELFAFAGASAPELKEIQSEAAFADASAPELKEIQPDAAADKTAPATAADQKNEPSKSAATQKEIAKRSLETPMLISEKTSILFRINCAIRKINSVLLEKFLAASGVRCIQKEGMLYLNNDDIIQVFGSHKKFNQFLMENKKVLEKKPSTQNELVLLLQMLIMAFIKMFLPSAEKTNTAINKPAAPSATFILANVSKSSEQKKPTQAAASDAKQTSSEKPAPSVTRPSAANNTLHGRTREELEKAREWLDEVRNKLNVEIAKKQPSFNPESIENQKSMAAEQQMQADGGKPSAATLTR